MQQLPAFDQDTAFGVGNNVGTMTLHQVRLEPETGFTRAGAADDNNILVSGGHRVLGATLHGQMLRLGQDHILLEVRIDIRLNVLTGTPSGRAVQDATTGVL